MSKLDSSPAGYRRRRLRALVLIFSTAAIAFPALAAPPVGAEAEPWAIAQAKTMDEADHSEGAVPGKGSRPLEPRYQPLEPEEKSWYNGSYIFGLSRSLASSTIVPAAKAPLFVLTVPLDIAFLPFALIGGMFG